MLILRNLPAKDGYMVKIFGKQEKRDESARTSKSKQTGKKCTKL